MQPELDYAFLAEFAKVEPNGTLTSIGASYTRLAVPQLPSSHQLTVAGRLRAPQSEPDVPLRMVYSEPGDPESSFRLEADLVASGRNSAPYGEGWVGVLFVFGTTVPLMKTGLHKLQIEASGEVVRRLYFEVLIARQP